MSCRFLASITPVNRIDETYSAMKITPHNIISTQGLYAMIYAKIYAAIPAIADAVKVLMNMAMSGVIP